ncbi:hypothetical protein SASPL_135878 [Salvia splendens]|uniref:Uncharacterized protein n=1 Tax=Salvia splendens TaxID=180675 RepID=A0A8X8WX84_SALSN|nr:hypothetical protein SASPL_135878 [Salvia splendens]
MKQHQFALKMYESIDNPHQFVLNHRILPLPNDFNRDCIEMIALEGINYTSLKDLMPEFPPSSASDSWREIPIKDPLVQHAAWAYLQPMMAERQSEDRRWWMRFHEKVSWLLSCLDGVVLVVFQRWFPEKLRDRLMIRL